MLERINLNHLDDWRRMRSQLWPDCMGPENERETLHALSNPDGLPVFLWLNEKGTSCGFIELSLHRNATGFLSPVIGYIEGWWMNPEYRRLGLGRQLVEAAEKWAIGLGLTEMGSDADADNAVSIRAHQRLGYSIHSHDEKNVRFRKILKKSG